DPVLVVMSDTSWKPFFGAWSSTILRPSWQNRLSQLNSAIVFRSVGPPCSGHSLKKVKILPIIELSFGPVRQNHFRPLSVTLAEAQGWQDIGIPCDSATGWMSELLPLVAPPSTQPTRATAISCSAAVPAGPPVRW